MRKEQSQNRADSKEILNLECIEVGVMGRLVIVEHEVNDVPGGANEEKLERSKV